MYYVLLHQLLYMHPHIRTFYGFHINKPLAETTEIRCHCDDTAGHRVDIWILPYH